VRIGLEEQALEYRQLGSTGIEVSAFGLGVMTYGGQTPEEDAMGQLDLAFGTGVTLFDTAENYPTPISAQTQGRSEEVLGRWIKTRGVRDKVIVATKVAGPGNGAGPLAHIRGENRRLDRANIGQAVDDSLRRLGTDYIDLYQVHWSERAITTLGRSRFSNLPDRPGQVPIEETLLALSEVVAAGKVRAIGVCNESPWGVMCYLAAAQRTGAPRLASIQNGYSLLDRSFELGLAEVAMREQVGLVAYLRPQRTLRNGSRLQFAGRVGRDGSGVDRRLALARTAGTHVSMGSGPAIVESLQARGIPVLSVNSPTLFARHRDIAFAADAMARSLAVALEKSQAEHLAIVGSSFGADMIGSVLGRVAVWPTAAAQGFASTRSAPRCSR
jgi:aryl-alcohol dehydrogenase-like predicted oxidoreductase